MASRSSLLGTLVIQALLTYFATISFQTVGERAVVALRSELFGRILSLPMRFFGERRVGELSSRLSADLTQIQELFTFSVPQAIRQTMLFASGLVAITLTSLHLSLVMAASLPPVILVSIWYGRRVRKAAREAQDCLAATATIVEETLQNIGSVKAYTSEAYEERRYGGSLERFLAVVVPAARTRAALIAFIIVGIFGSIILVLWYGSRLMRAGDLSHGELTRFTLFTMLIGGSVASAADLFSTVNRTAGASQRVRELLREVPEPLSPERAGSLRLAGDVQFQQVSFAYPSRPELPVLDRLTLHAAPGERIALVGPSGAGKSTIVSLLLRFYEPLSGRILLDGRPGGGAGALGLAGKHGDRAAGGDALRREHPGEYRLRASGRERGGDSPRRAPGELRGIHRAFPGGVRDRGGRARRAAFRRAAAAHRDRPRAAEGSRHPHPGRSDLLARLGERAPDPGGARHAAGRAHRLHHRAPAFDHPPGGPHLRHRARAGDRERHARRAGGAARAGRTGG